MFGAYFDNNGQEKFNKKVKFSVKHIKILFCSTKIFQKKKL